MKKENIEIKMPELGQKSEVIIREVEKVNELEVKAPLLLKINGTITSVFEFILKRISEFDQINQKRCHILVERQKMEIRLITNENDFYQRNEIIGKLETHPKFLDFGINQKKEWEPAELGQFFKMNRVFFLDKSENMKIVTDLKNFKAKIDTTVEKQKIENGSFNDVFSGIVTSNLPGSFKLHIPLFKGQIAEDIEVEIYSSINGRQVSLQLFSPGANQAIEEILSIIIDNELEKIKGIASDIAIIEQ